MACFMSLAIETRLQIYQEALIAESEIDIYSGRISRRPDLAIGLVYSCRKIYHEASPILYEDNKFAFHCNPVMFGLAFPHPQQRRMRKVEMDIVFISPDPNSSEELQALQSETEFPISSSYALALARDVKVIVEGFEDARMASLLQSPGPGEADPSQSKSKLQHLGVVFNKMRPTIDLSTFQLTMILAPFLWLQGLKTVQFSPVVENVGCNFLREHMMRPMLPHPLLMTVDERGDLRDRYHRSEDGVTGDHEEHEEEDVVMTAATAAGPSNASNPFPSTQSLETPDMAVPAIPEKSNPDLDAPFMPVDSDSDWDWEYEDDNGDDDDDDDDDETNARSASPTGAYLLSYGVFPDNPPRGPIENRSWKPGERGLKSRKSSFDQQQLARYPDPGTGVPGEETDEEDPGIGGVGVAAAGAGGANGANENGGGGGAGGEGAQA